MQQNFELRWRRARSLENEGQQQAAKAIYQELIEEDPERLYVRLRLSAIEQGAGNYRASLAHAIRCAESVRHTRWKDLAVVTRLLMAFDERLLVRDLIMGVDWSDADIVRNSAVLSQHLWLIGEVEAGLRLVETAEQRARPNAALGYSKANALRYLGRMKEATEAYESGLQLNPNDAHVHWSLAYHQKATPALSRVPRLKAALSGVADLEQPFLHYALFKEFDDAGATEEAWHHLETGAALKRKSIRYNPAVEEQAFDSLRKLISVDFVQARDDRQVSGGHVPIFIVGMPRSGTTLLERILGGHSDVQAGGELDDFSHALNWESNQFLSSFLTPQAVDRLSNIDFSDVGARYLERTSPWAAGKPLLIDKNPANFAHAGFIAKALPSARILCLRRGAMDACMSNLKILFTNSAYGYSYNLDELADYYLRFDQLSRHWREVLGGQYMEVGYEDLVQDPIGMTEKVTRFCGLSFHSGLVEITKNTAPVTTASSSQVRQPINPKGIGAWRVYERQLAPLKARLEAGLGSIE